MTYALPIREWRTQILRLSQADAAARIGVTAQTWGQWETGRRIPSSTTLLRIAGEFEVTIRLIPPDKILVTNE